MTSAQSFLSPSLFVSSSKTGHLHFLIYYLISTHPHLFSTHHDEISNSLKLSDCQVTVVVIAKSDGHLSFLMLESCWYNGGIYSLGVTKDHLEEEKDEAGRKRQAASSLRNEPSQIRDMSQNQQRILCFLFSSHLHTPSLRSLDLTHDLLQTFLTFGAKSPSDC